MYISEEEKKRKFESGLLPHLQRSLKVYPHKSLSRMMESAIVAESLHTPGVPRKMEMSSYRAKQERLYDQPKNEKKRPSSYHPAQNQKSEGPKKKKTRYLAPEEWQKYKTEGRCFKCGEKGHMKANCPKKDEEKEQPDNQFASYTRCTGEASV